MLTLSEGCSRLWLVQSEKTFHLKINLSSVSHSFVLNSVLVGLAWQCKLIHLFTKKHSGGFPSRWTKNPVLLEQSEYENFWSLPDNLCNPSFESHSAWDESVLWWRIKALSALVGLMISFSISRGIFNSFTYQTLNMRQHSRYLTVWEFKDCTGHGCLAERRFRKRKVKILSIFLPVLLHILHLQVSLT